MSRDESSEPLLLTIKEAARVLTISDRTLWTLTKKGLVQSVRIGHLIRYAMADLEAYIDSCRTPRPKPGLT